MAYWILSRVTFRSLFFAKKKLGFHPKESRIFPIYSSALFSISFSIRLDGYLPSILVYSILLIYPRFDRWEHSALQTETEWDTIRLVERRCHEIWSMCRNRYRRKYSSSGAAFLLDFTKTALKFATLQENRKLTRYPENLDDADAFSGSRWQLWNAFTVHRDGWDQFWYRVASKWNSFYFFVIDITGKIFNETEKKRFEGGRNCPHHRRRFNQLKCKWLETIPIPCLDFGWQQSGGRAHASYENGNSEEANKRKDRKKKKIEREREKGKDTSVRAGRAIQLQMW